MFGLVCLKSRDVYKEGSYVNFCIEKNKSMKFSGRIYNITEKGVVCFDRIMVKRNNGEYVSIDSKMFFGVYEINCCIRGGNVYDRVAVQRYK